VLKISGGGKGKAKIYGWFNSSVKGEKIEPFWKERRVR
jgi:hypothetical protein